MEPLPHEATSTRNPLPLAGLEASQDEDHSFCLKVNPILSLVIRGAVQAAEVQVNTRHSLRPCDPGLAGTPHLTRQTLDYGLARLVSSSRVRAWALLRFDCLACVSRAGDRALVE